MFGGNQYKGILGITQKMLAKQEQEQYRANANVGDSFFKPGVERIKPEQRIDSASYGNKSVFSPQQSSNCENVFGNQQQRQMSMPNRGNVEGPLAKLDEMYNGEPGVQKEDFKQFKK